ncbi:Hypothetical protein GbCGDNIH6_0442 [Granulibacter bethesdensis]|uniref:YdcF family protein n=1 Tax=Granulibacter bethesdensis TaxID=364410 RepID=UPI00090A0927|nr:YdcF family protein [Granulibacter bethesdensis]APH56238.1 Hypothetical protein GbCGDNIH6_0442 [Granulibacter bethesdensis]
MTHLSPRPGQRPCIVIFGAAVHPGGIPSPTLRRRVEAAHDLGRKMPDVMFMPTGGVGRHGPAEAEIMRRLLLTLGVPDAAILMEPTGTDTLSSAKAVAALLRKDSACHAPVFVATSRYHMGRCVTLLRLAGIAASAGIAPDFRASGEWKWWLRDCLAWPYDVMLMIAWRLNQLMTCSRHSATG